MPIFRRDRPHPILADGAVRVASRPQPSTPTPEEELPDWVMSSVLRFLEPFFAGRGPAAYGFGPGFGYTEAAPRNCVIEIERTCQIPIPWQNGPNGAANAVWQQIHQDRVLAVRVIDYALGEVMLGYETREIEPAVKELNRALQQAGANYVVVQPNPQRASYRLERRTIPAAAAAARAQTSLPGNASDHLGKAWSAALVANRIRASPAARPSTRSRQRRSPSCCPTTRSRRSARLSASFGRTLRSTPWSSPATHRPPRA
jgi:hypothetical protein